ncbi:putative oxidoreductase yanE [Lachnellula arida]|uniref:Putative oxidoreductase yanE n=1 Tax=Lachnellula arida TaxID=1316785 RepID=A0A8T9B9J8_9HELO|nr:putative oxidoreductase yanE [Lachnellula arida]
MANTDVGAMQHAETDTTVTVFKGAVTGRLVNHPDRSFALEITMDLIKGAEFFDKKPPVHFHVQEEYIECIQGRMGLELNGKEKVLSPEVGRVSIKPYVNHVSYPLSLPRQQDGNTVVKFLLSGERTDSVFELNPVFFENWYRYQDKVVVQGEAISLIQLLSTFDAGGTYVVLPGWIPFSQTVSRVMGVVVGRWIGGMLGYQPFYRHLTTDWELACQKMEMSIFQRRFADRSKTQ